MPSFWQKVKAPPYGTDGKWINPKTGLHRNIGKARNKYTKKKDEQALKSVMDSLCVRQRLGQ